MTMGLYAPEPDLYFSACARIEAVKAGIEIWRGQQPLSDTSAVALLDVLERGCKRLQEIANRKKADWDAGHKDRRYIETSLAFITQAAASLGSHLSVLEARQADRGIPEIALPLTLLLKDVVPQSLGHSLVFSATYDFNFYYQDLYKLLEKPLMLAPGSPESVEFRRGLPNHVALIAYSTIERENILTLMILLHELSHYADFALKLREGAPKPKVSSKQLTRWMAEAQRIEYVPDDLAKQFGSAAKVAPPVLTFFLQVGLIQQINAAHTWIREITADVLASRILGMAFFLTHRKFLGFFPNEDPGEYPPPYRRLAAVAIELLDPKVGVVRDLRSSKFLKGAKSHTKTLKKVFKVLNVHYREAGQPHVRRLASPVDKKSSNEDKMEYLRLLARDVIEDSIRAPLASIVRRIRKHVIGTSAGVTEACFGVADLLKERIAPSQDLKRAQTTPPAAYSVQETLNGAWLTLIEEVDQTETPIIWRDRLRNVSRLAMRGIELAHALVNYPVIHQQAWQDGFHKMLPHALRSPRSQRVTGVLTHKDLVERLLLPKGDLRLVVSPVMNTKQIGESSIDVRLGNAFYVVSKTRAEFFAIKRGRETRIPDRYYEFHKGTIDEEIVLHPGEFVLGSTLEYLSMPADLMAYVIGRSTIGRLGLIIATATHVAPGYKGTLTLELTNVGTVAIKLKPGVRIAQLVFHTLTSKVDSPYAEHGRYTFSVGPEIPKL